MNPNRNHRIILIIRNIHNNPADTYIIKSLPGQHNRTTFAQQINATEIIHLRPHTHELHHRATTRPNPRATIAAINQWITDEETNRPTTTPDTTPTTTKHIQPNTWLP